MVPVPAPRSKNQVMKYRTHLEIQPRRVLVASPSMNLRTVLVLLLAVWLWSPVAIGQCNTVLQSGGPIATLRGRVLTSVLWDPDGAGPMPRMLVVGGLHLTGGDQLSPVGLLAHDGVQWRGLGFDIDQQVGALAVFNGELVAAGSFILPTASGTANRIARRNGSVWQVLGNGMSAGVNALAVYAGDLVAAGLFATAGNVQTGRVAKWNGTSWSALSALSLPPLISSGSVVCMAVRGSLYFGGFGGILNTACIVRWNGTSWSNVATSDGVVTGLSPINGTTQGTSALFAAGSFTNIAGVGANHVARSTSAVTSWSAMSTGLPQLSQIQLLAILPFLGSPEVIAAGAVTNGTARVHRWNGTAWSTLGSLGPSTGSAAATAPNVYGGYVVGLDDSAAAPRDPAMFRFATDWTPLLGKGLPTPVQCLAFDGPDAIAGGAFPSIDGVTVNGIARRSGTTWSALGSGMTGGSATVKAVVRAANGNVFAGGSFTSAGGNAASNVARWNGSAWAPLGTGTNGTVRSLLVASNGDLIAGGDFTSAGGVACNRIARWNGAAWSQLASGMDNSVRCLALLANGQIVAGGTFVMASGLACNRIALWNGVTWSPMAGGMDGAVNALALRPNGELAAGGAFTIAGGNSRSRLARWNGFTWLPLSVGVPDTVNALMVLPDGDLLAGGLFATGTINHLARWDGLINAIDGVGSGVTGPDVLAFAAAPNGDVFIGGDFDAILPSQPAGHLAIMTTNCPALVTSVPTACVGPGGPLSLVTDTLPWIGSTFRSTASGFAPQSLAFAVLGLTAVNLPLSQFLPVGLPNCNLLASPDSLILAVPVVGASQYQFAVPDNAAFSGVPLSHQFVQLQLAPSGSILSLSSSNALTLVFGVL